MTKAHLLLSLLPLGAACSGGLGGGPSGDIVELAISPAKVSLVTTAEQASTQQFTVNAIFQNGAEESFDLVGWSLSNTAVGGVDEDGLFTTSTSTGGETWLTAESSGLQAYAEITVIYDEEAIDEGLPDDVSDAFDGDATDASTQLVWIYPENGVALPRNLPEFAFMWNDATGSDLFKLTFSSSTTNVSVYTQDRVYTVPEDLWSVITATNAGSDVTVTLEAVSATVSDGGISDVSAHVKGSDISFRVNRFDAQGAVYYWSVARNGIMRSDVDEADPVDWFGPRNDTTENCVGCHVISPDGTRVSYGWQVSLADYFQMGIGDIGEDATPSVALPMDESRAKGSFSTWAPDSERVIFAYNGTLTIYDAETGTKLGEVESDDKLTHPSWSPDGKHLAAVRPAIMYASDSAFMGGEIVVFDADEDGNFTTPPWTLVSQATGYNQYYPSYSPDGEWLVFNRSTGSSYFNEDAAVWLVDADGGTPIELVNANKGANLTNSWPRWGPIPDDDVLWLAFASTRDYGSLSTDGTAHVWACAINTKLAEQGEDPSFPAFWLVQQEVGGGNHAPWWSLY